MTKVSLAITIFILVLAISAGCSPPETPEPSAVPVEAAAAAHGIIDSLPTLDQARPVLEAILNAPEGFEILPADSLKKLREVRTQILKPEIAAELETARKLNTVIEGIFWLVKKELDRKRRKELPSILKTS